jgi:hypothetical protein
MATVRTSKTSAKRPAAAKKPAAKKAPSKTPAKRSPGRATTKGRASKAPSRAAGSSAPTDPPPATKKRPSGRARTAAKRAAETPPPPPTLPVHPSEGSLADTVDDFIKLRARDEDWTPRHWSLAELAMKLAQALDEGAGLATAAVAREFRATLGELAPATNSSGTPLEQLLARLSAPLGDGEEP